MTKNKKSKRGIRPFLLKATMGLSLGGTHLLILVVQIVGVANIISGTNDYQVGFITPSER